MHGHLKLLLTFGTVSYFLACAPVKFSKLPAPKCHGSDVTCVEVGGTDLEKFTQVKTVGSGIVDILIVNDNSGSMSFEQRQMAQKFPNFIQSLGNIDYRIGMITTDVSSNFSDTKNNYPGPNNGQGSFQDGALLEFAPGVKFLDRRSSSAASLFASTVQRNETIKCEDSGYKTDQCPSGDERGIFAATLAVDRNDSGFLRPTAPLAVIVLADEDVRSGLYSGGPRNLGGLNLGFNLQDYDRPETFVSRFRSKFPSKTLSVHSIVVKSDDQACLNAQANQGGGNPYVSGSFGKLYESLSSSTGGMVRSICSNDYGRELGEIGFAIQDQVSSMSMVCRPVDNNFEVSFSPQPNYPVNAQADFERLVVEFDRPLPPETRITLSYTCKKLSN